MAIYEDHGDLRWNDHDTGERGIHTTEAWDAFISDAARNAKVQVAIDRGRIAYQSAGTVGWFFATGTTGNWERIITQSGSGGLDVNKLANGAADDVLLTSGATPTWGKVADANVSAGAAIAGTKVVPAFGAQAISTTGTLAASLLTVQHATEARIVMINDAAALDEKRWREAVGNGSWAVQVLNDAGTWIADAIKIVRSATTLTDINLGADLDLQSNDILNANSVEIHSSTEAALHFRSDGAGLDLKRWRVLAENDGSFKLTADTDAGAFIAHAIVARRTASAVTEIDVYADLDLQESNVNNVGILDAGRATIQHATAPQLDIVEGDAALDEKWYRFVADAGSLHLQTRTDSNGAGSTIFTVNRTLTAVDSLQLFAGLGMQGNSISNASSVEVRGTAPSAYFYETDAGLDEKFWQWVVDGDRLYLRTLTDGGGAGESLLNILRTGTAGQSLQLTNLELDLNGNDLLNVGTSLQFDATVTPTIDHASVGDVVGKKLTIHAQANNSATLKAGDLEIKPGENAGAGADGDLILGLGTTGIELDGAGKIGMYGAAMVAQGTDPGALTDSTGGTADGTLADVGASYSQSTLNNNFADLAAKINALRALLSEAAGGIGIAA